MTDLDYEKPPSRQKMDKDNDYKHDFRGNQSTLKFLHWLYVRHRSILSIPGRYGYFNCISNNR
jgi:hypothetical protein